MPIAGFAWALKTTFTDKVEPSESSLDAISSYWSGCEIGARCSPKLFSSELVIVKGLPISESGDCLENPRR